MSASIVVPSPAPSIVWLLPLVPSATPIPPEIDRLLARAARAAITGDASARDALFAAFQPRFERSIRRCQRCWDGRSRNTVEHAYERADIAQEAYLVFVDLLQTWPGGGSISAFLCARFPWRLNDAIRSWRRPGRAGDAPATVPDRSGDDGELAGLIDEITADMPVLTREMLRWRVFERLTFAEIARRAGVSKRTVNRRWDEFVIELDVWGARETRPN